MACGVRRAACGDALLEGWGGWGAWVAARVFWGCALLASLLGFWLLEVVPALSQIAPCAWCSIIVVVLLHLLLLFFFFFFFASCC